MSVKFITVEIDPNKAVSDLTSGEHGCKILKGEESYSKKDKEKLNNLEVLVPMFSQSSKHVLVEDHFDGYTEVQIKDIEKIEGNRVFIPMLHFATSSSVAQSLQKVYLYCKKDVTTETIVQPQAHQDSNHNAVILFEYSSSNHMKVCTSFRTRDYDVLKAALESIVGLTNHVAGSSVILRNWDYGQDFYLRINESINSWADVLPRMMRVFTDHFSEKPQFKIGKKLFTNELLARLDSQTLKEFVVEYV